jgi:hypothetical protein
MIQPTTSAEQEIMTTLDIRRADTVTARLATAPSGRIACAANSARPEATVAFDVGMPKALPEALMHSSRSDQVREWLPPSPA